MTDDEVDDYVRYLHAHLPPAQMHLSVRQVRDVLDAEGEFYERRFGKIRGWWALLREIVGRGQPSPDRVEDVLPEFEAHVLETLRGRADLTRDDVRAIMTVEGEIGPRWAPPPLLETPSNVQEAT